MSFLKQLFHRPVKQSAVLPRQDAELTEQYRRRMHWEAQIGGALFGPVAPGNRREFFCLDERTWIWHEEWQDEAGRHIVTTRYDVRPEGVFKTQGARPAEPLSDDEARNLYYTVTAYCDQVLGRTAQAATVSL